MKSQKTQRRDNYKKAIPRLFNHYPEAKLTKNRYRTMKAMLRKEWPNIVEDISYDLLQDIVYVDRLIRKATEGEEKFEKKVLSQEKQIELGYEGGSDIRLKNI